MSGEKTPTKILNVIGNITYKTGWYIKATPDHDSGALWIRWSFEAPCAKTGEDSYVSGRQWRLSPHMTESEIVQTALLAALTAEEHEAREMFKYKGKRVFNPHISVQGLLDVCENEDVRDGH